VKLFRWLSRRWLPRRRITGAIADRTWGEGECSPSEAHFIERAIARGAALCPDCELGDLLRGPQAPGCVNAYCGACGAGFNLMFIHGALFRVDRIREAREGGPAWSNSP
jgi:hypothetical protein